VWERRSGEVLRLRILLREIWWWWRIDLWRSGWLAGWLVSMIVDGK
jgi:hypothetical protein